MNTGLANPELFADLPVFPTALPDDELRLLRELPEWPTRQEIADDQHAPARRLEKRGLIKIERSKDDPIAISPTWYGGKLAAAAVRKVTEEEMMDCYQFVRRP